MLPSPHKQLLVVKTELIATLFGDLFRRALDEFFREHASISELLSRTNLRLAAVFSSASSGTYVFIPDATMCMRLVLSILQVGTSNQTQICGIFSYFHLFKPGDLWYCHLLL